MDRRLNEELDNEAGESTVFLRNAGANVRGVAESIKRLVNDRTVDKVVVRTHTDCGAMKFVKAALAKETKPSSENYKRLVRQFEGMLTDDLDNTNTDVQLSAIRDLAVDEDLDVSVDASIIDLSKLNLHTGSKHVLAIVLGRQAVAYAEASRQLGVLEDDTYFIQALSFDEVLPDIDIAVSALGLNDIRFVSVGGAMHDEIDEAIAELKRQPFFSDKLSVNVAEVKQ
jgi:hypothetical protein